MSFDPNWDIENCRENTENDLQWSLRKAFIQKHINKYSEDHLIALSKVFENMEFMGCIYGSIYNVECMKMVRNLAEEVPEILEHWKSKKKVVETVKVDIKIEKTGRPWYKPFMETLPDPKTPNSDENVLESIPSIFVTVNQESNRKNKRTVVETNGLVNKKPRTENIAPKIVIKNVEDLELYKKVRSQPGIKGKLIIINDLKKEILFQSAGKLRINLKYHTERISTPNHYSHQLKSNNEIIVEIQSNNQTLCKTIKNELQKLALNLLQKYCFTITSKNNFLTIKLVENKTDFLSQDSTALQGGIGAKIMQQMGWKGTGLGKNESGIQFPIQAIPKYNKIGLGNHNILINNKDFVRSVTNCLENYSLSEEMRPLQFCDKITKGERKSVRKIVKKLGLKMKSNDNGSFVQVEKEINHWELVEDLLANGRSSETYFLTKPTCIF